MKHLSLIAAEFVKMAKKIRNDPKRVHKETGKSTQTKAKSAPQSAKKNVDNKNKTEEQFLKQYGNKQVKNPDPKGKKKTISLKSLKSRHYKEYKQMLDSWRGGKTKQDDKKAPVKKKVPDKKIDKTKKIENARTLHKKEKADIDKTRAKLQEKKQLWFNKLPSDKQQKYLDAHPKSKKELERKRLEKKLKDKKNEITTKPEKVEEKKTVEEKNETVKDKSKQVVSNKADSNYKNIQQQIKNNAKKLNGSIDILSDPPKPSTADVQDLKDTTDGINDALKTFGINGSVENVDIGPRFSSYHVKFDVNQLKNIKSKDTQEKMKLALKRPDLNININEKNGTADIETRNSKMQNVTFKELVTDNKFVEQAKDKHKTPIILGKDNLGNVSTIDISDPNYSHILIAGGSGSGKSVLSHQFLGSIFYGKSPDDVQMALIDPKQGAELGSYEGSKYLWKPIATNDSGAFKMFNDTYNESERRYKLLSKAGVRNLASFNDLVTKNPKDMTDDEKVKFNSLSEDERKKLPRIVMFADEAANLFKGQQGANIVNKAVRIGNIGRAAGINMILATQSPQAGTIPTKIQNNISTRLTLKLNTKSSAESVGQPDAIDLLGKGDMLFTDADTGERKRVQTGYISESESNSIAKEFGATGLKTNISTQTTTETKDTTVPTEKEIPAERTQAHYKLVPDDTDELKQFREDMKRTRDLIRKQRENLFKMIEQEDERSKKLLEPSEEAKTLAEKIKQQKEKIQEDDDPLSDNSENDKQNVEKLIEEIESMPIKGKTVPKIVDKVVDNAEQIQNLEQKDTTKPKRTITKILQNLFSPKKNKSEQKESEKKSSTKNRRSMNDNEFNSYMKRGRFMKHLAKIQSEFLRYAASWEELSYDAQKDYLKQHPKSKKKLTAKPGEEGKDVSELQENVKAKKDTLSPITQLHDVIDKKKQKLIDKPKERTPGASIFPLVRQSEDRRNFLGALSSDELSNNLTKSFSDENKLDKNTTNSVAKYIQASLRTAVDDALSGKAVTKHNSKFKTNSLNIPTDAIKNAAEESDYDVSDEEAAELAKKVNENLQEILKHDLRFIENKPEQFKDKTVTHRTYKNIMKKMFDKDEWKRFGLDIGEDTSGELPEGSPALTIYDEYADYAYEIKDAVKQRFSDFGMTVDIYDGGDDMYVYGDGDDSNYFKFENEESDDEILNKARIRQQKSADFTKSMAKKWNFDIDPEWGDIMIPIDNKIYRLSITVDDKGNFGKLATKGHGYTTSINEKINENMSKEEISKIIKDNAEKDHILSNWIKRTEN